MQSSPETQLPERTPSEMKEEVVPAKSDEMTLLHGFNRLYLPEQIRRRVSGKSSVNGAPQYCRQQSFGHDIGHAAAETYLVTRLSFNLLGYFGVGYRWITRLLALACYAILLMPGFLQVGYLYFFSPQGKRSVVYGHQPRNRSVK